MWTCDLDMSHLEFGHDIFVHVMFWTCYIRKMMIMCRVNDPSGSRAPAINGSKADMKQKLVT